eukprot:CAMPEP_0172566226 /NCGR_PEP_ID=MMETSP1067-20121228/111060_1 /TAXON_ID=265564 ORGANISM="Thalassiosira punctigera, Strain Tpunct2005C2" /NCGR_SAMPLE_ID=MMETSP1067 /ASSEMBLY_ACC=CAM_ASM_000444 /LENGTH=30 /DNA_ID= /DNA_START= /DNA_END= /DNA_ORIENTATION=
MAMQINGVASTEPVCKVDKGRIDGTVLELP